MTKTTLLNNRYKILKTIARGGFGETSLAIDTHLPSGKKCVIKQLKPMIEEPQIPDWMLKRFEQEARILEDLGEKNAQIPCLYAYFSEKNQFYLVQEFIDGFTLTKKVEKQGTLSQQKVEKIVLSLLSVLDFIHNQRIVHRDIKPDNIILRQGDDLPFLIDFGVVKEAMATVVTTNGHSAYSVAIGTPGYMASEQAAGRPIYSSDLYSLALTAIYLLTGKSPQNLQTDSRNGEILWREAAPDIHSNLATVLDKAIRFHPKDRFSTAKEMLEALQPYQVNSTASTIAMGGKSPQINQNSEFTQQKTVIANPSNLPENNPWWKSFLPLFLLSAIALGTFVFGFNVLLDKSNNSESETVTETNIPPSFPLDNNTNPDEEEKPDTETKPEITESNTENREETPPNQPEVIEDTPPKVISKPKKKPPSIPNNQEDSSVVTLPSIPIIGIGTSEKELINKLGKPTSQKKGYWNDSVALLYKNATPEKVDLGYILHKDTRKIRQTEASFNSSTELSVLKNTLNGLLQGKASIHEMEALRQVYEGETDLRSFNLGDFKAMIERRSNDRIYIGVWAADFH